MAISVRASWAGIQTTVPVTVDVFDNRYHKYTIIGQECQLLGEAKRKYDFDLGRGGVFLPQSYLNV